ncbi:hypothetical protein BSFA1_79830 (plasmid) [Burkholderia sp. SFA1]|nr:hypothetical protein BYI23_E000890 [Burkholderia sp. YI23]BBQ02855.1 hypothetical protein BSFA1_79830 [Burkholderia sp. SFA1]
MRFVLLSAGWYLNATVGMNGTFYVADSLAPRQEFDPGCHFYGPAAWGGKVGPTYGRELIALRPLHWDEWFSSAEDALYSGAAYAEPLRVWPARITVTPAGRDKGLGPLDGLTIQSESELVSQVNFFAARHATQQLQLYTAAGRLQSVAARVPGQLGVETALAH